MKHSKTIVSILLNIVFCAVTLWFFTRNAFLRPYAGSPLKETLAGLLLLGVLYANYFLFYPVLYQKRAHIIYWLVLFFTVLTTCGQNGKKQNQPINNMCTLLVKNGIEQKVIGIQYPQQQKSGESFLKRASRVWSQECIASEEPKRHCAENDVQQNGDDCFRVFHYRLF